MYDYINQSLFGKHWHDYDYSAASFEFMEVEGKGRFMYDWGLIFCNDFRAHPFFYALIGVHCFCLCVQSVVVSP
jgi:hypothetical protein